MNPIVTVVIPLYNAEKYIAETLQSVLAQTYPNIEVLVIDDGSTDDSLVIAKTYESEKVKVFSQPNKGASAARNYGLREAKGDYIQFLDADDLLSSNKIEEQVKVLVEQPSKVALCPTIHFFDGDKLPDNQEEDEWFYEFTDNPSKFLIKLYGGYETEGGMIQPNSWLTPRNIVEKVGFWNEQLSLDDDGEFFCRVVLVSTGVVFTPSVINYYRKFNNNRNLSSKKNEKAVRSALLSLELKQKHLLPFKDDSGYKKAFARAYKRMAVETYPEFKKTTNVCMVNINYLNGTNHDVVIGGKGIEYIKKIFGWKVARLIQYFLKR